MFVQDTMSHLCVDRSYYHLKFSPLADDLDLTRQVSVHYQILSVFPTCSLCPLQVRSLPNLKHIWLYAWWYREVPRGEKRFMSRDQVRLHKLGVRPRLRKAGRRKYLLDNNVKFYRFVVAAPDGSATFPGALHSLLRCVRWERLATVQCWPVSV